MIPVAIEIEHLIKTYKGGVQALRGISLTIKRGRLFALLGPNGAGKSTLLRILTTLSKRDSGRVLIDGLDPERDTIRLQKCIGVASQDNDLDPSITAEQALRFQGRLFGLTKSGAALRAGELLSAFQLESEKDKKAESLSGGNKRRLHCALALVHHPEILFLDEPTVGMDPIARSTFWSYINRIKNEDAATIFLTTQYLDEADKYADCMALLTDGVIRYSGPVSGFKAMVQPDERLTLEESYIEYIREQSREPITASEEATI